MAKSVTIKTNSNWTQEKPTDLVVEAYGEVCGMDALDLPPSMYEMTPVQAVDSLFQENKCDTTQLHFEIGDVTIDICNENVRVTKQDPTTPYLVRETATP